MLELIFLAGSILGIAAMVFINSRLSIWTPARLEDLDDARQRLDTDAVGFDAGQGVMDREGRGALVEHADNSQIGLLTARGDTIVIRYLTPGSVRAAKLDGEGGMRISLEDFTFAPVRLDLEDTDTARFWADKLNAMQAGS